MAPEGPGSLVVLDLLIDEQGDWAADVDRLDPEQSGEWLRVSWTAKSCTGPRQSVGGGVVCAVVPMGYKRENYLTDEQLKVGTQRLLWRDKAPGGEGLMLVVVLPQGWVINQPTDASLPPVDVKRFGDNNRFAAYWILGNADRDREDKAQRVAVWWYVTRLEDTQEAEIAAVVNRMRDKLADLSTPPQKGPVEMEGSLRMEKESATNQMKEAGKGLP